MMTCAELDLLLTDYLDDTLGSADETRVEAHLASCASCAALVADLRATSAFLERIPEVEPPPELITRILFRTQHAEAIAERPSLGTLGDGFVAKLRSWFGPVLQPRFAMGMAMTILSFSMVGRFAGLSPRQITVADLDPVKIYASLDNKVHRTWERAVKYYENLRVVYEIQGTLSEWSAQEEEDRRNQQVIEPKTTSTPAPAEERR